MTWLERLHGTRVHTRRVQVLAAAAAKTLPAGASVLDIGCGDGQLAETLARLRPDLAITGVEVAPRAGCRISAQPFDGLHLPFPANAFATTLLVDVLHHLEDPGPLLHEAVRVSQQAVILKDHFREGWAAQATLRFMDELGNRRHGVPLPHHYLNRAEWARLFRECRLTVATSDPLPRLYPFPANLIFGRGLHFLARLQKAA